LNNKYVITEKNIKNVLDKIDNFISNMSKFTKDHSRYGYSIDISLKDNLWVCEINIKHEKQENNKALRESI
jgi:hypothetical protein